MSRSTSWQLTPTPILTVSDLAALPRGRVVVMPSGAPAALAQPVPWWETKWAEQIRASINRYDSLPHLPAARTPNTTRVSKPVDHNPLNGHDSRPSLAGLEPIIQQTAREVLEQHVASLVRKAIGGRLTSPAIEELARHAADENWPSSPTRPACTSKPCRNGSSNGCCPSTAARSAATSAPGARNGRATPKPSPASNPSGAPGSTYGKTPRSASRSGFATTPTTT